MFLPVSNLSLKIRDPRRLTVERNKKRCETSIFCVWCVNVVRTKFVNERKDLRGERMQDGWEGGQSFVSEIGSGNPSRTRIKDQGPSDTSSGSRCLERTSVLKTRYHRAIFTTRAVRPSFCTISRLVFLVVVLTVTGVCYVRDLKNSTLS